MSRISHIKPVILIILGMVSIAFYASAGWLYSHTVGFPIVKALAGSGVIAAGLCLILANAMCRLTGIKSRIAGGAVGFILVFSALWLAVMAGNKWVADHNPKHVEQAVVVAKYKVKQENRRRVGKRYVGTGTYHYSYEMGVEVTHNNQTDTLRFKIPQSRYNRLRTGSMVEVEIHEGIDGSARVEMIY